MKAGKLLAVAVGAIAALIAFALLAAGSVLLWAQTTQRDPDGFYSSPTYRVSTDGYAVVSDEVELSTHPGDWVPAPGDLRLRVTAQSAADRPLFLGVAPQADVEAYLADVPHAQVSSWDERARDLVVRSQQGSAAPAAPAEQGFWAASTAGSGTQTLTWDAQRGSWVVVVMNADASPMVELDATAGVDLALLQPVAITLLVAGVAAAVVAAALLVLGTRGGAVPSTAASPVLTGAGTYPVRIAGQLDPELSRWQWLIKWLLAIPHLIVLAFLWAAFMVLTVVAGIAILFTGRYPRAIFDFNVGVLRWSWQVTFYAYGVLGTDRYPKFSLAADPSDLAVLEVDYPERLSRGLVLVKWWLLAIPHYLIVAFFTGSALVWSVQTGQSGARVAAGGGLIGVLVVIAGVLLAITGRYPQGLFDFVMGLQRWVYRVIAYAALMTDVYPPFRLDSGGAEPGTVPAAPVPGDVGPQPAHA